MLLRRVLLHVAQQNWTAVALDLAIVIIGVFIGIQTASWSDDRAEQRLANDYLQYLLGDMREELNSIIAMENYYARVHFHGERAASVYLSGSVEDPAQFLIDLYQASQFLIQSSSRSTYDEMQSSGLLRVIRHPDARNRIVSHYNNNWSELPHMRNPSPFREVLRRHMPYDIQAAIRDGCGDAPYQISPSNWTYTLPESCEIELDDARARLVAELMIEDRNIRDWLSVGISDTSAKLSDLNQFKRVGANLLEFLEQPR